ncbi:MAG: GNAT family N-acetyltransferase [Clostridia bacterium]|nr:GNAT family N-acetyltransferase [Clostridia bacterium]
MVKHKVAFICVHNSCRSQIAEALGRHLAADVFQSFSAGIETKPEINPDAVRLMKTHYDLDLTQTQYSKLLSDIPSPDMIISMGCNVTCPSLGRPFDADWGLPDPTGKSDEEFLKVISAIEANILALKAQLQKNPYVIRTARSYETDAVNDLFLEMLYTIHPNETHSGYAPGDLDRYFTDREDRLFVAEADGKPVAFLALEVHREEQIFTYVDDFSVTEAFRNQGIGHALMAAAENHTRAMGIPVISLHVEKHNQGARRLYERLGYTLYEDQGARLLLVKEL